MSEIKQSIKRILHRTGLYAPVHQIWVKRPDIRLSMYNFGYRLAGAADGLPIPPTRLIRFVKSSGEIAGYLKNGEVGRDGIVNALLSVGYHIENFERVLDFGCGCGRMIRRWKSVTGPHFYGTDVNPELIHWCQAKLANLADFKINRFTPPLDYPAEYFDLIYSISVFTHIGELAQEAWMGELYRVLMKSGVLIITVHGKWRINDLSPDEQSRFNSGHLVVKYENFEGSNLCATYHPEAYVRNNLAKNFKVLSFLETGAIDVGQDMYVLSKIS